jgi:hypothetical protein
MTDADGIMVGAFSPDLPVRRIAPKRRDQFGKLAVMGGTLVYD